MTTPQHKHPLFSDNNATVHQHREIVQPAGTRYFGSGSPFAHPCSTITRQHLEATYRPNVTRP